MKIKWLLANELGLIFVVAY